MRADTVDEKDERLTGAHYASEAAARDLPTTPKVKKAKVAKEAKAGPKVYHVRLKIESDLPKEQVVAWLQNLLPTARVRRIREVE